MALTMTAGERARLRDTRGLVGSTETFGTVDGPGIRYVQFLQGCPLRCLYCHNPDVAFCPGGERVTAGQSADDIERYRAFIKNGGVTFSGGEPLVQAEYVEACCRLLAEKGFHTAIDTSGSEDPARVKAALDAADLILLDIKAFDPDTAMRLTGRDNRTAFKTLDYLQSVGKPVWIRHVLLRGYTLDKAQLRGLAQKIAGYTCVEKVELLPFHKLGEGKWQNLGLEYKLAEVEATTGEEAEWARDIFREYGLVVQ